MSIRLRETQDIERIESMKILALSTGKDVPLLTFMQTHDVLTLHLCLNRGSPDLEKQIHEHFAGFETDTQLPEEEFRTWRAQAIAQNTTNRSR